VSKFKYRSEAELEWRKWYADYLLSPEWKARRAATLARCGGICEACGKTKAAQVHHTTYDHAFHEPLWELRGVCEACHDEITKLDKQRKRR